MKLIKDATTSRGLAKKELNECMMDFSSDQLAIIKNMFAKNLTNDELTVFLMTARRTGLDPSLKQIYAIKRGNAMTIQTSIDGLRLIAERTGRYSPGKDTLYSYDKDGRFVSATSYVKKMTADGTWHEVSGTAFFDEYTTNQNLWKKIPKGMTEKCAEAKSLRRAFPDYMSSIYVDDEMEQADVQVRDVPEKTISLNTFAPEERVHIFMETLSMYPDIKSDIEQKLKNNYNIKDYFKIPADLFIRLEKYVQTLIEQQKNKQNPDEQIKEVTA